jgi:hypothetical protein
VSLEIPGCSVIGCGPATHAEPLMWQGGLTPHCFCFCIKSNPGLPFIQLTLSSVDTSRTDLGSLILFNSYVYIRREGQPLNR